MGEWWGSVKGKALAITEAREVSVGSLWTQTLGVLPDLLLRAVIMLSYAPGPFLFSHFSSVSLFSYFYSSFSVPLNLSFFSELLGFPKEHRDC